MHRFFACLILLLQATASVAATPAVAQARGVELRIDLRAETQRWLLSEIARMYPDVQAHIDIGPLDARLTKAPCLSARFFLPAGARLWSTGSVGVRCTSPEAGLFYLGYQTALRGPALVLQRNVAARAGLSSGDVTLMLAPYTQDPGAYPRELPQGASSVRPLAAGQAIVLADLLLPDLVHAGAQVRVRATGSGFSVAQEGKALSAGKAGAMVQVKMPGGRIVRGTVTPAGEVNVLP